MPISPEKFKQIIAKTSQKFAEEAAEQAPYRSTGNDFQLIENSNLYNTSPDLDYSSFDGDEGYSTESYSQPRGYEPQINPSIAASSKLPSAIKESLMSDPIDVSSVDPNHSIIDDIAESMGRGVRQAPRRRMNEQVRPQAQVQIPSQPSIDYSLIKTIVNECIKEQIGAIKKEILSEGTLQTIGLSGGKIKLVDNKGNVFTAALKKQGNIND